MDASIHVIQPFQPPRIPADRRRRESNSKRFDLDAVIGDAPGSDERHDDNEHPTGAPIPAREEGTGEHLDVIA